MSKLSRRVCLATTFAAMNSSAQDHARFMRRAIELAANAPSAPFGALLVDDRGKIVAEGWNQSKLNPTFHGEIDAINNCARLNAGIEWAKLTLYTTAEPCPMCQSAVAWAGISTVVYGSSVPFLKSLNWWQIDIRADEVRKRTLFRKSALIGGVLEKECNALFIAAKAMQK